MANILDEIIEHKRAEIQKLAKQDHFVRIADSPFFERKCNSLLHSLSQKEFGIISEFKRRSPSKGWINENADILAITENYARFASAFSILTDSDFFGGKLEDIQSVRPRFPQMPILRKDFIVDHKQLEESKGIGADIILLIAAVLSKTEIDELAHHAQELGMEILFEIHSKEELLEKLSDKVSFVGVNNRNLKTFDVSLSVSQELIEYIPKTFPTISESGIQNREDIEHLVEAGFKGFLIGESFMKDNQNSRELENFLSSCK